jgi:anti-anti-sigma factor
MEIAVSELDGGVTCVRLRGRMDAAGAGIIDANFTAAVAAQGRNAVVDLQGVSFVASMGLRLLISTAKTLHGKGARMVLYGAEPLVRSVLDEAALDQIIPVADTEPQALALLRS